MARRCSRWTEQDSLGDTVSSVLRPKVGETDRLALFSHVVALGYGTELIVSGMSPELQVGVVLSDSPDLQASRAPFGTPSMRSRLLLLRRRPS